MTMFEELLVRLKTYLAGRNEVVAAYLFGSIAEGVSHSASDVDIALLLNSELDEGQRFTCRLEVAACLTGVLGRPVDVIILNDAPPVLRFQVIQKGHVLLDNDETERCLFHLKVCNEYYDLKPYLDYHTRRMIARIERDGIGGGYHGYRDALAEARRLSKKLASASAGESR